jgi:hypothetical protein
MKFLTLEPEKSRAISASSIDLTSPRLELVCSARALTVVSSVIGTERSGCAACSNVRVPPLIGRSSSSGPSKR